MTPGRPSRKHQTPEPKRYHSRDGRIQVAAFVALEQWRRLRNVATSTRRTQIDLITEAIDDLTAK